jgi:alkyl sulfatase BDS1-like metallo-beta-lactamase superfamily hydrolase
MGGSDEVVRKAKDSFAHGDYRWVAEVLNHVVMADPEHIEGRALLADTFEQLGYQSESAPWRNFYLCGALELRNGLPESKAFAASGGVAAGMPIENFFQVLAVRLLPEAALDLDLRIELVFTDLNSRYLLSVRNSVLNYFKDAKHTQPQVTLTISSLDFKNLLTGATDAAALLEKERLEIDGDASRLLSLRDLFDQFVRRYPLVTPRDQSQR